MENPYKAPDARVADAVEPARRPRPPAIRRALIALWLSWTLGLFTLIFGMRELLSSFPKIPVSVMVTFFIFFLAFSGWLLVMVTRGRNWARWTFVTYMALAYLVTGADPEEWGTRGPLALGPDPTTLALDLYGCALILFGAGAAWFKHGPERKPL